MPRLLLHLSMIVMSATLIACRSSRQPDRRYSRRTASILASPLDRLEIKEGTFVECLNEFDAAVNRATAGTGRLGYVFVPPRLAADDNEIRAVRISESRTTLHHALLLLAHRWGYRVILSDPVIPESQSAFQSVGEVFFIRADLMD